MEHLESEHERLADAVAKFLEVYDSNLYGDMPTLVQTLTKKLKEEGCLRIQS